MSNVQTYLNLVTSEHASKPKFMAALAAILQGQVDNQNILASLSTIFDVDTAVGVQLDAVGRWVNRSRFLDEPLTNLYFSFDERGLGFDQEIWLGPFDPTSGLVQLEDETYRAVIKAVILANQWDGTIPGAYGVLNAFFVAADAPFNSVLIQDNGDMTMTIAVVGPAPTLLLQALLRAGVIDVEPAGVAVQDYYGNPFWPAPFFGFDVQNSAITGFDHGAWAVDLPFVQGTQISAFSFNFANFFSVAVLMGGI